MAAENGGGAGEISGGVNGMMMPTPNSVKMETGITTTDGNNGDNGMTDNYSIGHLDQTGPLVNGPGAGSYILGIVGRNFISIVMDCFTF